MSCVKSLSRVWLSATPWTAACQAPLSVGFSRQGRWSGLPFSFSWCVADLKCSVSFRCTAKWFIHRYRCILAQIVFLYTLLHDIEYSSSRCTVGPWCSPVSCVHAKTFQPCHMQPMDGRPPGSSVPGTPPARILQWVCHALLSGSFWPRDRTHISYASCFGSLPRQPPGKPFMHSDVYKLG